MKNLKQSKLSFTPILRKSDASTQESASAAKDAPAKSQRPQKASSTKSTKQPPRVGRAAMECVEVPVKRSLRFKSSSNTASSSKPSPAKSGMSAQARKPSLKRKFSPPPDADTQHLREVVHVPRIAVNPASSPATALHGDKCIPSHKKLRLSSPVSDLTPLPPSSVHDTELDDHEFVPTSQSGELELTLPRTLTRKDPVAVQETIAKWRKEASAVYDPSYSPISIFSEVQMEIDLPPSDDVPETPVIEESTGSHTLQYPQTPCSAREVDLQLRYEPSGSTMAASASTMAPVSRSDRQSLRNPSIPDVSPSDAFRSLTPPPSSDTDTGPEPEQELPPVVKLLDTESKTAKLIADIKARAYAAAHSSPEPSPIDLDAFNDSDSDSSSEEDVAALIKQSKGKGKAKAVMEPAKTASSTTSVLEATQRYNLRRNSPSYKPKARPTTPPPEVRRPSAKAPIDALLREKKREERNRTGMVAVRAAEETLAKSKADLHKEMEEEEDGSSSDTDWEQGLNVLRGDRRSRSKVSSPIAGPSGSQRSSRRSLAGSSDDEDEDANAVGEILAKDMKENMARAIAKQQEQPLGVPLWPAVDAAERDASMDVESTLPIFAIDVDVSGNAALKLLKRATEQNDVAQVSALLASGLVALLAPAHYLAIVPWLVDIAFSDVNPSLSTLAYTQLVRLAPRIGSRRSGLSLSSVLRVLFRLGGSPTVLEKYGWWAIAERSLNMSSDYEHRDEMTYRLAIVVDAFASSFPTGELGDILLAMVLVGMDPTTPEDLKTQVRKACDSLEQVMGLAQQVQLEACQKLVAFGKTLSPPTQALLITFIPGTSASTVRMARCVARSLLLRVTPSPAEYQKSLPELLPVIDLLMPEWGSYEYFDIPGNTNKEGYYDDLTCRLSLLGRVLSDIDEYTMVEKQAEQKVVKKPKPEEGADEDKDKDKEKDKEQLTLLQQVSRTLDLLHGKIVDTRAAHLDRSRAKAALQRLSFRVHYQRVATLKSGAGGKPDLRKYFKSA